MLTKIPDIGRLPLAPYLKNVNIFDSSCAMLREIPPSFRFVLLTFYHLSL